MNRRDFLRRGGGAVVGIAAGNIFVPQFGRWFRPLLSRLFTRAEPVIVSPFVSLTEQHNLNAVWRKVQEEMLLGFQFESIEWSMPQDPKSFDISGPGARAVLLNLADHSVELIPPRVQRLPDVPWTQMSVREAQRYRRRLDELGRA